MDWIQKLDELNSKGWDIVTGHLRFPDGRYGGEYPKHWTTEQCVNEAYAYVDQLERNRKYASLVNLRQGN